MNRALTRAKQSSSLCASFPSLQILFHSEPRPEDVLYYPSHNYCTHFLFCVENCYWVGVFYLCSGLLCIRLVLLAYSLLVWSLLLTVETRFGLFCLPWKLWSFLLAVPPVRKLGLVFSAYGSPPPSVKKTNRK